MYTPLPTNKTQLLQVVEDAVAGAQRERNIALIEWYIIHYYMQGVRLFTVRNWEHGDVQIAYENSEDELTFRWEHILRQFRVAMGRFSQVDISPAVEPSAYALNGTRDAAVAYATLNFMLSHINKSKLKSRFLQQFLKYGTVGLRHQRVPGRNLRERTAIWLVPPWELLCYPAEIQTLDNQRGLWHSRKVPLAWLRTQKHLNLPNDDNVLKVEFYRYGSSPDNYGILDTTSAQPGMEGHDVFEAPQSVSVKKTKHATAKWVQLDEGWIFGDRENEVREYVVRVGRHIAAHDVYPEAESEDSEPVLCPISIARHTDTGRFYGRGEIGPLIGINDQVEKMLSRQFQIVSDQDEFGMLLIPTTAGLNMRDVKKRERRKILQFEPDPLSPQIKPEVLAPYSSGDQPGKLVNFGVMLQDKMAGTEGGMFEGGAPGRVDSAAGLGFLHQTSNVGLIGPSNNIGDCFRDLYMSILSVAREEVEQMKIDNPVAGGLELPFIDDRMVGLVLDPATGQMSLADNPIPHPYDVVVDIADREPTNAGQAIQEAKEQMQMGNMSYTQFVILNFQKNWGLPIADRSKWEAFRKAVYLKILLFNDGETPGEIPFNVEADDPEVTLLVIKSLMSSLEFLFASDTVRTAFEEWKMTVELGAGARYPQNLPMPEENAERVDAAAGPGPAGPPPPGGPPSPMAMMGGGGPGGPQ